jgi:hypothetical protein
MGKVTRMETYSGDEYGRASPVFSPGARGHNPVDGYTETRLEVVVIFTDTSGTLAAMQMADRLAQKLEAHLRVLMPYEVPFALPLTKPAVAVSFLEDQLRTLASKVTMEIAAQIFLCRDKWRTLRLVLEAGSLVIVGDRKRWWPTPEQRLARALSKDGHHVVFAELR